MASHSAGLGATGGSAFGSTAGREPGLKRRVEALEAELHTSNERIDEVSARLGDEDDKNTDIVDSFRDELAAAIKEIRAEFSGKIEALTAQVATLQRQLNVSRGEANILAQQNKDTARRLAEMGEQVAKLAVEVVGDDEAAATGALAGSA